MVVQATLFFLSFYLVREQIVIVDLVLDLTAPVNALSLVYALTCGGLPGLGLVYSGAGSLVGVVNMVCVDIGI